MQEWNVVVTVHEGGW